MRFKWPVQDYKNSLFENTMDLALGSILSFGAKGFSKAASYIFESAPGVGSPFSYLLEDVRIISTREDYELYPNSGPNNPANMGAFNVSTHAGSVCWTPNSLQLSESCENTINNLESTTPIQFGKYQDNSLWWLPANVYCNEASQFFRATSETYVGGTRKVLRLGTRTDQDSFCHENKIPLLCY